MATNHTLPVAGETRADGVNVLGSDFFTAEGIGGGEEVRSRSIAGPADRPSGTAVYYCFRYERSACGLPVAADGTVILGLPTTARGWRQDPWCRFKAGSCLDVDAATTWLGDQLRGAAEALAAVDPAARPRLADQWRECEQALLSLESACQTTVAFPDGNQIAMAIVAVWDSTAIHPLLRGSAPNSEWSGR